ncbi:MAG: hypothetical protein EXQ81_05050 [Thermoleophilia bacterium]|nr:hypothetical protein [Thermoleophilia bacterium]
MTQRSGRPSASGATALLSPAVAAGFDSVGNGFSGPQGTFVNRYAPPDINSAVGLNEVFTTVNTSFAIQNKAGAVIYGPAAGNTLFTGFGGACETSNDGDPVIRYDRAANRWVFTQFVASTPYLECVAVSTTASPTGTWNRYSFPYKNFPDYPKLSVWPDAYYVTYNQFRGGTTFVGALSCAMDRAKMLAGLAATQQCFSTSTVYGGLLPADLDSAAAPPSGAPNVQVALGTTSTSLAYWKFHVDWVTPANTTFTGPTSLAVASYTPARNGGTCIPQSGTTTKLDTLGDRLMFRLGYRNFGDHESLVVSHAVTAGSSVGVRWYELRLSGQNPTVYQQGTYAPDSSYRWMSSMAMDLVGNIGLGYSRSSSSLTPATVVTGRLAGDTLGLMTQGETTLVTSGGSQTGNLSRWGDYSSMNIDPAGDCTFWYSSEYLKASGSFNWSTRIGSFTLPGCLSISDSFSLSVNPTAGTVTQGSPTTALVGTTTTFGNPQTVALTASGLPAGATATFSPASFTSGASSTMTVATSSSTPAGTYAVSVTGTGTAKNTSTPYVLTVNNPTSNGITNGGFETGSLVPWLSVGTNAVTSSGPYLGMYTDLSGSTSATNGDSAISQTFVVPSGKTRVSASYKMFCSGSVANDWATITLTNTSTGVTSTLLAKTCSTKSRFRTVSATVTAGMTYTITLTNHDDNNPANPTYTWFDNIVLT